MKRARVVDEPTAAAAEPLAPSAEIALPAQVRSMDDLRASVDYFLKWYRGSPYRLLTPMVNETLGKTPDKLEASVTAVADTVGALRKRLTAERDAAIARLATVDDAIAAVDIGPPFEHPEWQSTLDALERAYPMVGNADMVRQLRDEASGTVSDVDNLRRFGNSMRRKIEQGGMEFHFPVYRLLPERSGETQLFDLNTLLGRFDTAPTGDDRSKIALELIRYAERERAELLEALRRQFSVHAAVLLDEERAKTAARMGRDALTQEVEQWRAELERLRNVEQERLVPLQQRAAVARTDYANTVDGMRAAMRTLKTDTDKATAAATRRDVGAVDEAAVEAILRQRLKDARIAPMVAPPRNARTVAAKCVPPAPGEAPEPTPYQRAVAEMVGDARLPGPGVLAYWDVGAGKTIGAAYAIVRHMQTAGDNGQVVVLGRTMENVGTFDRDLRNVLNAKYGQDGYRMYDKTVDQYHVRYKYEVFNVSPPQRGEVILTRMQLKPQIRFPGTGGEIPKRALLIVDEAHEVASGTLPRIGKRPPPQKVIDEWIRQIGAHRGKKLLLTATPAGNLNDPKSLMLTLHLLFGDTRTPPPAPNKDVSAAWFRDDEQTGGKSWRSDAAQKAFENYVRGAVSYLTLRFDQTIYPAVSTTVCNDDSRACVLRFDINTLQTQPREGRELTPTELQANRRLHYQSMVPVTIEVPLRNETAANVITQSEPAMKDCIAKDITSGNAERCAREAIGFRAALKSQSGDMKTLGAGNDLAFVGKVGRGPSVPCGVAMQVPMENLAAKTVALRAQVDAYPYQLHLIIGSLNKRAGPSNYMPEIHAALQSANGRWGNPNPLYLLCIDDVEAAMEKDGVAPKTKSDGTFENPGEVLNYIADKHPDRRYYVLAASDAQARPLQLATHPMNATGKYIEAVVLDGKSFTGVDVKGARVVHLLSPPESGTDQKQAWGRGLRRCAMAAYAQACDEARQDGVDVEQYCRDDALIRVFTYVSVPPTSPGAKLKMRATPDQYLMRWMRTQRSARNEVDLMYEAMQRVAVDQPLFGAYSSGVGAPAAGDKRVLLEPIGEPAAPMTHIDYVTWAVATMGARRLLDAGDYPELRVSLLPRPTCATPEDAMCNALLPYVTNTTDAGRVGTVVERDWQEARRAADNLRGEYTGPAVGDSSYLAAGGVLSDGANRVLTDNTTKLPDPLPLVSYLRQLIDIDHHTLFALLRYINAKVLLTSRADCDALAAYGRVVCDASNEAMASYDASEKLVRDVDLISRDAQKLLDWLSA